MLILNMCLPIVALTSSKILFQAVNKNNRLMCKRSGDIVLVFLLLNLNNIPFHANIPFLYILKTSQNQTCSDIFKGIDLGYSREVD